MAWAFLQLRQLSSHTMPSHRVRDHTRTLNAIHSDEIIEADLLATGEDRELAVLAGLQIYDAVGDALLLFALALCLLTSREHSFMCWLLSAGRCHEREPRRKGACTLG